MVNGQGATLLLDGRVLVVGSEQNDGWTATLAEVFTQFRHKVADGISPTDLADLLRFLRSI